MKAHGIFAVLLVLVLACLQAAEAYQLAFVWANDASAASYSPNAAFSFNAGEPITITRYALGRYEVELNRVLGVNAHVQVTMYGRAIGYCTVWRWNTSSAFVDCYNGNGIRADRRFNLLALEACGNDDNYVSYAWLNNANAASYTPLSSYSFGDGTFLVNRYAVGRYRVDLGTPAGTEAAILVSTYGANRLCNVRSWGGGSVSVDCRRPGLAFADSRSLAIAIKAGFLHTSFAWNSTLGGNINPGWSHSSDGSAQSITRFAPGRYRVTVGPEANSGGHVQVVSYGSNRTCNVISWSGGVVTVACSRFNAYVDSRFIVVAIN